MKPTVFDPGAGAGTGSYSSDIYGTEKEKFTLKKWWRETISYRIAGVDNEEDYKEWYYDPAPLLKKLISFRVAKANTSEEYEIWYDDRLEEDREKAGWTDMSEMTIPEKVLTIAGLDSYAKFINRIPTYLTIIGAYVIYKKVKEIL